MKKITCWEVDCWQYEAEDSSGAFALSFVFGGGQHSDEILVALVALRFGKNFEAAFGEGLHEKHGARSGLVTYNWL